MYRPALFEFFFPVRKLLNIFIGFWMNAVAPCINAEKKTGCSYLLFKKYMKLQLSTSTL